MLKESFMELSKETKLREIQNYTRAREYDYGFFRSETSHSIHPCFSVGETEKVIHRMETFYWINDYTIYITYKPEYTKWRNVIYQLTSSSGETQQELCSKGQIVQECFNGVTEKAQFLNLMLGNWAFNIGISLTLKIHIFLTITK